MSSGHTIHWSRVYHVIFKRAHQRRNEGLPRVLCVVRFYNMAPVLRTCSEFRGFLSSIFLETKRLSEVSTLDIRSLLFYLLSADYFVGIDPSI